MTLDDLVVNLKRLERAAQRNNEDAGAVVLQMDADGRGTVVVEDTAFGWVYLHHEFTFDSPHELETLLDRVIAGMEAEV